ncbi:hypothetical protein EHQ43_10125 [Leptospira bouyouniensis]|uniref:30S ribosomal protein S1 n=1 Tax=Leptospira bouyouniensis TaxID=2484911 RepID=A0A7I0HRN3_9LEPT|nr:hypothetical protein [Leptospira bouyouniensis]TGL04992.1 hypothetical protein EHQ43_10125 [Leptospira bouyouniensis]
MNKKRKIHFKRKLLLNCLVFLFFGGMNLFGAEIELPSGNKYLGKIISEDERSILFQFQGKDYRIPKSELTKIEKDKSGGDFSIGLSRIVLHDNSQLIGYLIEEDQDHIILQTQLGFVNIDKSRIEKSDLNREKNFPPPKKYLVSSLESLNTFVGLGYGFYRSPSLDITLNQLYLSLEPAYLDWKGYGRIGLQLDGIWGVNSDYRINMFNGIVYYYSHYQFPQNPLLNFYGKVGLGGNYVNTIAEDRNRSGLNPLAMIEIGWQGYKINDFQLRLGINTFCGFETTTTVCFSGPTIQGMLKF